MLNKYAMVVIVTLVVVAAVSSKKAPLPTALSDVVLVLLGCRIPSRPPKPSEQICLL